MNEGKQCFTKGHGMHLNKRFSRTDAYLGRQAKEIHYNDVIMTTMASQITSPTVVYSIVYSGVSQRKHESSALLAVNSPLKGPVTRKMLPFDDVIMTIDNLGST